MTNSSDNSPASLQAPNKLGKDESEPSPTLQEANDSTATTGTDLVPYAEKPEKPDDRLLDRLLSLIGLRTVGSFVKIWKMHWPLTPAVQICLRQKKGRCLKISCGYGKCGLKM